MAVWHGLKNSLLFLASGLMIMYICGRLAEQVLAIGLYWRIFLLILPWMAAFWGGWHSQKHGLKNGFLSAICLYFLGLIFLIWFLPELLKLDILVISFVYCALSGALAAVLGFNLQKAKPRQEQ